MSFDSFEKAMDMLRVAQTALENVQYKVRQGDEELARRLSGALGGDQSFPLMAELIDAVCERLQSASASAEVKPEVSPYIHGETTLVPNDYLLARSGDVYSMPLCGGQPLTTFEGAICVVDPSEPESCRDYDTVLDAIPIRGIVATGSSPEALRAWEAEQRAGGQEDSPVATPPTGGYDWLVRGALVLRLSGPACPVTVEAVDRESNVATIKYPSGTLEVVPFNTLLPVIP